MATNNAADNVTAASGTVLQGQGVGTASAFSTATYPATASGTGTILRADGTNWSATTSTYPNTNAVSTLLYASSTNVMGALATANSGVLATSASGVPSIDTTNFAVLSTGVQLKGNNANTAPPAGFIGEQIRATLAVGSATALVTNTAKNVVSMTLTPGIWDVSCLCGFTGTPTGTGPVITASISTVSATQGTDGDNMAEGPTYPNANANIHLAVPAYRLTLGISTVVYMVAFSLFTTSTLSAYGRISATRVG